MNWYAHDKIRELEAENLKYQLYLETPGPRRRPVLGAIAAIAGRILLRAGETLEGWSRPAESEPASRRMVRRVAR